MLTKKLVFDEDVLSVIKNMEWSDDGLVGKILVQLDRKLYVNTNKALEAMGGKWNRKVGGHVFDTDPRGSVEGLLENAFLTIEKDGFFETPPEIVEKMLRISAPIGDILEPSAGLGAIVKLLPIDKDQIYCVEKNRARSDELWRLGFVNSCMDFLDFISEDGYDRIYMNPPFEEGQDIDHVMHAYSLLRPGGELVAIMSEGSFFRGDRKTRAFLAWLDKTSGYNYKLPEGSFKTSGAGVHTRLVYIKREQKRHK